MISAPWPRLRQRRRLRVPPAHCAGILLTLSLGAAPTTARAAVPPPEQLLPERTFMVLSAPDLPGLIRFFQDSPRGRLWQDPAMKPLKDKLLGRWQDEFVKPLERELGLSLASYAQLGQGQLTLAITRNAAHENDRTLGLVLLLDARNQSGVLRTNLGELRTKWAASGRPLQTDKIRDVELTIFPVTTNDLPRTLVKFLWRQPTFAQVTEAPDLKQAPTTPSKRSDLLLDMFTALLTASRQLVVCQVDSLLVAGNSVSSVEPVITKLRGGAVPTLDGLAAYQNSRPPKPPVADPLLYGWINLKTVAEVLSTRLQPSEPTETPDPFEALKPEKLVSATGLASGHSLCGWLQQLPDGSLFQLSLNAPETSRRGLFTLLSGPAKPSEPPPFVPADVLDFFRWRLDCCQAWSGLETVLASLSPQAVSTLQLILETAEARARQDDPGYHLKQTLLNSLGDDIITYSKPPRGHTLSELSSSPSLCLLGSPDPEQLAVALKRLFVIFPQGDLPAEREFLGRKIFSVPLPVLPFITSEAPKSAAPRSLSCAASAGYVALSTDVSLLEEFLRSGGTAPRSLHERPGLREASQRVGGMSTGLFDYENDAEAVRIEIETARLDSGSSTNGIGPNLFPGLPGISGPEASLNDWVDFSLLPAFERVSPYFSYTIWSGSTTADGFKLSVFTPTPPALPTRAPMNPGR